MDTYPKISIITPNYNGGKFLEETILSVLRQDYPNLEYIIIDGCSTDKSTEIIKKYENKLTFWCSEEDNGMYDAIQKGFDRSTGEIMGWINSDDILHNKSLYAIADIFSNYEEIKWIQGYPNVIDELGRIVSHREPRFNKYNFYLQDYHDGIFIQQESTFWRRELWEMSGGCFSKKVKYAGDFELWIRFFRFAELYSTKTLLGSFRIHDFGQISKKHYQLYILECDKVILEVKETMVASEKRKLSRIQFIRKIKMFSPFVFKILNLKRTEKNCFAKPYSVEYDLTTNRYKTSV